jgi:predicted PurR-regulated permease PerM
MRTRKWKFASRILAMVLLLAPFSWALPGNVMAQAAQTRQWLQEEQMRQAYERQQWQQWQRQEQARQAYERQQWLQWQQQEKLRQMYSR